jgi:DNA polymerase-3 subunit delta
MAMPFLADRRLVAVKHAAALGEKPALRRRFLDLLTECPRTTALVLIENEALKNIHGKKGGLHWLEAWGREAGDKALVRLFAVPKGGRLVDWIVERARELGGEISPRAAAKLAGQVGADLWTLDRELDKLLTYVNFERAIDMEDVQLLAIEEYQEPVFALVDAVGNRDRKAAVFHFHKLLADQDVLGVLGMIVRQFRILLLAKEGLEKLGNIGAVVEKFNLYWKSAEITRQAKGFSLPELVQIYHRLLEVEEAFKTGEMEADLGIDLLLNSVTTSASSR